MTKKINHVLVILSSHGFGHVAMTAPIINALHQRHPQIKITLRTTAPRWFLEHCYHTPFDLIEESCDIGMLMHDAFNIDLSATAEAYRQLHSDWPNAIAKETQRLQQINPDLILSNIAYLPFMAAKKLGIPSVAFCCLNWADIYSHYYADNESQLIHQQILSAYHQANLFLRPTPTMPMDAINSQQVGLVASCGKDRRQQISQHLGLKQNTRYALVSLGGISTHINNQDWPKIERLHYLVPNENISERDDISTLESAQINFNDALKSAAVFITKPGYGSFSEAACSGTPVLYAARNWPEQPYLTQWLKQHLPCQEISEQQLNQGDFQQSLLALLSSSRPKPVAATGITDALDKIRNLMNL